MTATSTWTTSGSKPSRRPTSSASMGARPSLVSLALPTLCLFPKSLLLPRPCCMRPPPSKMAEPCPALLARSTDGKPSPSLSLSLSLSRSLVLGRRVVERPQHMFLRVAVGIHKQDLVAALKVPLPLPRLFAPLSLTVRDSPEKRGRGTSGGEGRRDERRRGTSGGEGRAEARDGGTSGGEGPEGRAEARGRRDERRRGPGQSPQGLMWGAARECGVV